MPRRPISCIRNLVTAVCLVLCLSSCPFQPPDTGGDDDDEEVRILGYPELTVAEDAFIEAWDKRLQEELFGFTIAYNRAISLANATLFADYSNTSRSLLKARAHAAVNELTALMGRCLDMEAFAETEFVPALEQFRTDNPSIMAARALRSWKALDESSLQARKLVDMLVDPEYDVSFNLSDIARKTGISMAKLRFLMQQAADQFDTDIDINDVDVCEEEIRFCETVRDTASTVNSTLALNGVFGPVAAASGVGSSLPGWLSKTVQAVYVMEKPCAAISFVGNSINIAVPEAQDWTAFKHITGANNYLGIFFGVGGYATGADNWAKAGAVFGTSLDVLTTFFSPTDDGIQASTTPQDGMVPAGYPTDPAAELFRLLPSGHYLLPDVDLDSWSIPDFSWGGPEAASFWEDVYEWKAFDFSAMEKAFDDFTATWDPSANTSKTREASAQSANGLPPFFDDPNEEHPDTGQVVDDPEPEDFSVTIQASRLFGLPPFAATFFPHPNDSFLPASAEFTWDFDDGTPILTLRPGDPGYGMAVEHSFTSSGTFDVSLLARDGRGYDASATVQVRTDLSLQDLINSYGPNSVIPVPAGEYSGSLELWEGCTLKGAGIGQTILTGEIELHEGTRLEGLTVQGARGVWLSSDGVSAGDVFEVYLAETRIEGSSSSGFSSSSIAATVTIDGVVDACEFSDNAEYGLYISPAIFAGTIKACSFVGNGYGGISVSRTTASSLILDNLITANTGTGFSAGTNFAGAMERNILSGNDRGCYIQTLDAGASFKSNTIKGNTADGGMRVISLGGTIESNSFEDNADDYYSGGLDINTTEAGSSIRANTFAGNSTGATGWGGGGICIYSLESTMQDNVFTGNRSLGNGGAVSLRTLPAGGLVTGNLAQGNSSGSTGGGFWISGLAGSMSGNTVSGNSAKTNGGGVYASGLAPPSPLLKDSNSISGNSLTAPPAGSFADLYTSWAGDDLPTPP